MLQTLQCDLHSVESRIANFRKDSEKYSFVDGGTEMQKYISELEDRSEEVAEALKHLMLDLESELERSENYSSYYQVFCFSIILFQVMNKIWLMLLTYVFIEIGCRWCLRCKFGSQVLWLKAIAA